MVEHIVIESAALQGNRLGDSSRREVAIYLPPNYEPSRRYPVLYMLSSHGRTHHYYVNWNQWDETMPQRLDRLIGSGVMPPVIVAIPDCWTRFGGSQFMDTPIGNYASFLLQEVIPAVDARYSTIVDRDHRGVFGHSSGGYGALVHAMKHPDIFGGVASRAPDSYWEYTAIPGLARLHAQLEKWGGYEQFINDIPTIRPKKGDFWMAIHTIMECMAYAPNPQTPLGFDSPIDLETGELIPEVWERWLEHDPVRMMDQPEHQAALRQMHTIFLEVGTYDEYHLQVGARIMHRKLTSMDVAHQFEEFPDGHGSTSYRYDVSLPILAQALSE